MSAPDSSAQVVARFLRSNHYNATLEAFIQEAGLSEDAGALAPGAWTIEEILEEKLQYDKSVSFERQGANENQAWSQPAPCAPHEPQVDIYSNVLCVQGDTNLNKISVATADRNFGRFSADSPYQGDINVTKLGDSPVLSVAFVHDQYLLTAAMSGHLSLRRSEDLSLIDECRHHAKYAVQVVSLCDGRDWFIATAGWDQKVHIYAPEISRLDSLGQTASGSETAVSPGLLGKPVHTVSLISNPESLVFTRHPDTGIVYLVASRRDSTFLFYYKIERSETGDVTVDEVGKQNLAPHSNAWVAFTPCSLCLSPSDPTLLAVATSHIPHMKVIVARLLFPDGNGAHGSGSIQHQTQAAMARAELALQDREDTAIKIHVTTMAPQTPYSTPQVVWRPNGSGLFVNGDDGMIRGVELASGKVVALLKGHEAGSKVRTLWAGLVKQSNGQEQEILVSGGFDKKLLVWTAST